MVNAVLPSVSATLNNGFFLIIVIIKQNRITLCGQKIQYLSELVNNVLGHSVHLVLHLKKDECQSPDALGSRF